jgi:hypothetical protein
MNTEYNRRYLQWLNLQHAIASAIARAEVKAIEEV